MDWTFGTEELASYSRFVQQVEKTPCLFMQARDASRLGLQIKIKSGSPWIEAHSTLNWTVVENMASGNIFAPAPAAELAGIQRAAGKDTGRRN